MLAGKKVIGVCMTLIFNSYHIELIDLLKKEAAEYDCRIIVYNSVVDFYNDDIHDVGAKYIYDNIDYDIVDALVVFTDNFHVQRVIDGIVEGGRKAGKPVVVTDQYFEKCYCFEKDYTGAFKQLIRHVIEQHGRRNTFFLAGRKDEDEESVKRINIYKEVLSENGLSFREDMVDYGGYWSTPTIEAMNRLVERDCDMPDAIFCANDYMAITTCERLMELGYKIPEDIIVTGFDGIPDIEFFTPRISTCKEDTEELVHNIVRIACQAIDGATLPYQHAQHFKVSLGESCGCESAVENVFDLSKLYHLNHSMENHEAYMQSWIDKMHECTSYNQISNIISKFLMANSYVCLTDEFVKSITDYDSEKQDPNDGKMYVIWPQSEIDDNAVEVRKRLDMKEVAPGFMKWDNSEDVYVLTAIYVKDTACGYFVIKMSGETRAVAHMINRIARTLNIGFTSIVGYMRQKWMKESIEHAAVSNPVTGLPNLKGAEQWFEQFSAREDAHKSPLIVTVYSLEKYKYIYENYGIQDIEEVLGLIAQSLKFANQFMSYVAHISENEFLVVTYGKDQDMVNNNQKASIEDFYRSINYYNTTSGKDYVIEINHGWSCVDVGWQGSLASFSKMANAEMYMNRLQSGKVSVHKEKTPAKDNYDALNVLIEKNMFRYFFQPIVKADTGEVYAYEALMRTDASIGMNPLEVLEAAENYNRLYDIEKATLFNVMERYKTETDKFQKARIFINHIPGYGLQEDDYNSLCDLYGSYMDNFVFEITEQNSVEDGELDTLKHMGGRNSRIAVDDYGTGHSNIVNLLRYAPHIIKIDRFLMTDIDKDVNKQMFVKSTIEFARMNNIKILAEGVETSAEMRTVIEFGVDYIQGYYTGKPAFEPIGQIAEEIQNEIRSTYANIIG